jgi:MFS family permease
MWLCVAAAIAYIHRGCLSVPAAKIQAELGLTNDEMGRAMSAFYLSYALLQLPAGWLAGRWGSRLALAVFASTWSGATACMGLARGLPVLAGSCFLNGAGQAGLFPASVNTISKWFPVSQRAFPSGALGSSMSIGTAVGSALVGFLLSNLKWEWQQIFIVLSCLGFVWSAGFYVWFRNLPSEHSWVSLEERELIQGTPLVNSSSPDSASDSAGLWSTMLTSPQMYFICGQHFFRAMGIVFYSTWFPTYLQKTHGVSIARSGYLTTLPVLGVVLGALLGGAISDWIMVRTNSRQLSRKGVAVAGLLGCALLVLAAYFVADPTQAVLVIALGSFFAGIASPAAYTITMDLGGRHVLPVFSTMNMIGNFGGMLCPLLVARVVKVTGENWSLVLLLFVAIYLAAAACWALVNAERAIFADE